MKILQVTNFFKPSWESGGVARYAYEVSSALSEKGHDVTVYTTDGFESRLSVEKNTPVDVDGIRTYYFRNISMSLLQKSVITTPYYLPWVAREQVRSFDVVHFHGFRSLPAVITWWYAKQYDVPYVIHAHGSLPHSHGNTSLKVVFDKLVGDDMLRSATSLFALTPTERTQYTDRDLPEGRISVVPNGVRLPDSGTSDETVFRDEHGIPSDSTVLLYVGRIHERKGVDLLLDAFENVSDAHLVIIGPDDGYSDVIETKIESHPRKENVHFLGFVSEAEKNCAYEVADVFVLPSLYGEGLPTTVLEAALYGNPLVVTEAGNATFVEEHDAGEIVEANVVQLTDAINDLVSSQELRSELGDNARDMVEERFTWDSIANQLEGEYFDIVR